MATVTTPTAPKATPKKKPPQNNCCKACGHNETHATEGVILRAAAEEALGDKGKGLGVFELALGLRIMSETETELRELHDNEFERRVKLHRELSRVVPTELMPSTFLKPTEMVDFIIGQFHKWYGAPPTSPTEPCTAADEILSV